jgi:hypothetical protein
MGVREFISVLGRKNEEGLKLVKEGKDEESSEDAGSDDGDTPTGGGASSKTTEEPHEGPLPTRSARSGKKAKRKERDLCPPQMYA